MPSEVAKASSMVTSLGVWIAFGFHIEFRHLARELLVAVIGRESDFERALLADADADQLVLEAGNEGAGADLHGDVVAGAALEGLAVDLADKGNGHAVAVLGLAAFRFRGIAGGWLRPRA